LLIPFATCSPAACGEALRALPLPNLQRLLGRLGLEHTDAGSAESLSPPHERALARAWGLPTADGLVPLAALQAYQAGQDTAGQGYAWISPAHWQVGRDHVAMAHPRDLQLDAEDSKALLDAMHPYFAEDGITLTWDAPLRWLARGDLFRTLPTASLDRVMGRTIDKKWMPQGDAGKPLRRLQQEMQMLLYTQPLNDARQRGGLLPVNSFWASATGMLPQAPQATSELRMSPYLRDAALLGDWRAWAAAWQQVDERDCAGLLQELEGGREVRVTLCGEAGARTWSSAVAGTWQRVKNWFGNARPAQLVEGL
jgi:hypothetical protein